MSGQPILRTYRRRLLEAGGPKAVLDRLEMGMRFPEIAEALGISRAFLSFQLLRIEPGGKAAVWLARQRAAEAAARRSFDAASEAGAALGPCLEWIAERGGFPAPSGPTPSAPSSGCQTAVSAEFGRVHLEALKKATEAQKEPGCEGL